MTLEGANNFSENDSSIIYTMNSTKTGQYSIVMPKNIDGELMMLVDLNMKESFDALINNLSTKESLVGQINDEYKYIKNSYPGGILVFPMLDINSLTNSINSGDKQKMFDETKKIGAITSEIYNKLSEAGIDKSKINQKIIIVEKTFADNKFVTWLKEQMPNFVDGVSFEEIKSKLSQGPATDPFANINPFTGEASTANNQTPTNDIFGSNNLKQENTEVKNDIFSTPTVNNQPTTVSNDNVNPNTVNDVFEPQPIQNTSLESTQILTLPPASELKSEPTLEPQPSVNTNSEEDDSINEIDKKSGGFANLLILLVILIGVTVASIELGKFLYNTFGA